MARRIAHRLTALALGAGLAACGSGGSAPLLEPAASVEVQSRAAQRLVQRPYDQAFAAIQTGAQALGLRTLDSDMASGRLTLSIAGADPLKALVCTGADGAAGPFLKDAVAAGARLNGQALVRVLPEGPGSSTVITAIDYLLTLPADGAEEPVVFAFPSGGAAMRMTGPGETKTAVRCAATGDLETALLAAAG